MNPSCSRFSILATLSVYLSCFVLVGCTSGQKQPAPKERAIFGLPERSAFPREFLTEYLAELEKLTSPIELQHWAVRAASATSDESLPKTIDSSTLPKRTEGRRLNKDKIVITVTRDETKRGKFIIILDGGGGMLGWYGLKVGGKEFRPTDTDAYYLEWIPGCYLYLSPP